MDPQDKYKSYCELGEVLDELARRRSVRGPYGIAKYLAGASGYETSGQVVSRYLHGKAVPKRVFLESFAAAFRLTYKERQELAWVYAYGSRPPRGIKLASEAFS